jgi:hypothetical protein
MIPMQVPSYLDRLTNAGKIPLEENSLYSFEVVQQDGKTTAVQATITAASKVTVL